MEKDKIIESLRRDLKKKGLNLPEASDEIYKCMNELFNIGFRRGVCFRCPVRTMHICIDKKAIESGKYKECKHCGINIRIKSIIKERRWET